MVEIDGIASDVARGWFLLEEVATAGNTMGKGETSDDDRAVFIHRLWRLGIDFVQNDFVGRISTEIVDVRLKDALKVFRTIHMQVLCAAEQAEGREQTDESESVVAMQMGQEDGLQSGETDVRLAECHLCAFCTIEHEEFFADVDYLSRTEVFGCR